MLSRPAEKEIKARLSERIGICKRYVADQKPKAGVCKKAAENLIYWEGELAKARSALTEIIHLS